jgi:transposase
LRRKLSAICAAKEHGIKEVSKIYGLSRTTLTDWIKRFAKGSVEALKPKPKRTRALIQGDNLKIVKQWIEQDSSMTGKSLMIKIKDELGIKIEKSAVNNLIHRLGFAHITPRPKHYKKDDTKAAEFKKN